MFGFEMREVSSAMVKLFVAAAAGELIRQQLPILWVHKPNMLVKGLSVLETFAAVFTFKQSRQRLSEEKQ